jgi:hypothetical protein
MDGYRRRDIGMRYYLVQQVAQSDDARADAGCMHMNRISMSTLGSEFHTWQVLKINDDDKETGLDCFSVMYSVCARK